VVKMEEKDAPVVVRAYRDMPEAMTDRMILETAGIDCCLYDENTVRLDWLWSNLLGGVKLVVRGRDRKQAEKLLAQNAPEKFAVDGVGEYRQDRCPKCGSEDVSCHELRKQIAGAGLLIGLPIAINRRGWKCHACGHAWNEAEGMHSKTE